MSATDGRREHGLVVVINRCSDDRVSVLGDELFEEEVDVAAACSERDRGLFTDGRLGEHRSVQETELQHAVETVAPRLACARVDDATRHAAIAHGKVAGIEVDPFE